MKYLSTSNAFKPYMLSLYLKTSKQKKPLSFLMTVLTKSFGYFIKIYINKKCKKSEVTLFWRVNC